MGPARTRRNQAYVNRTSRNQAYVNRTRRNQAYVDSQALAPLSEPVEDSSGMERPSHDDPSTLTN
ncbi:uncharacterized protein NEPG_01079 [Nematocida parisii ERTm1]|uniref:Uncharacterized protein n=1 Tax=Nematocida parisii (strain ERTm3) TaxID=935791 RepID=I3EJJ4_NEMP3|nr:uncharacterized protein NEPG_01079 [Nematocida parisii ERTm1]EIJ89391.1 hypothetical protein NEQG_00161 [Nematocida parisii ERTm3]EIJ94411.1 hypothetical protein NEPG_01079 [Nematocida parisii ERTm1]KAI5146003.1 hypothetical protein NEPAR07_2027 [Nematocida parisii]|eukprot:XP_013058907.1 hypothetical protein NEPG_01079 [Nematocida parisii ERTm1]